MKQEITDIIKGIMIVIGITTVVIFICLRLIDKNYVYFITYYHGENKYYIKITDDYEVSVEISIICSDEKCTGDYSNKVINNVNISKEDVKSLIEEFDLKNNNHLETNEDKVTLKQKKLITKVIR